MSVARAEVERLVRRLYDPAPTVRHLRTSINAVFVLEFESAPDKILKLGFQPRFALGLLREQRVLPSLRAVGLEVSTLELTQDALQEHSAPFSIMRRDAERSLSQCSWASPDEYGVLFQDAGRWLARLHGVDPDEVAGVTPPEEARAGGVAEREDIRDAVARAGMLGEGPPELFARFEQLQERPRRWLIHGDYNASQVMTVDGALSYVVDWDSTQYGRPMRDLGLCLAYARFYDRACEPAVELRGAYDSIRPGPSRSGKNASSGSYAHCCVSRRGRNWPERRSTATGGSSSFGGHENV